MCLFFCPQFLKSLQGHKGEMSVLLFIMSLFLPQWGLLMRWFCKAPKDGSWVTGGPIMNRGLELSVPLPWLPGRGVEVELILNGQWLDQWQSSMANGQWLDQSRLCDEASIIKKKKNEFSELLGWGNRTLHMPLCWAPNSEDRSSFVWDPPYVSVHMAVDLYPSSILSNEPVI